MLAADAHLEDKLGDFHLHQTSNCSRSH